MVCASLKSITGTTKKIWRFLKDGEKVNNQQKKFNRANLPRVWSNIVEVLMRYVMLEGHFYHFHSHPFLMLNNFHYNVNMNFSF